MSIAVFTALCGNTSIAQYGLLMKGLSGRGNGAQEQKINVVCIGVHVRVSVPKTASIPFLSRGSLCGMS